MGNAPGFETVTTYMIKKTFKNKSVTTIEELWDVCHESGVKWFDARWQWMFSALAKKIL